MDYKIRTILEGEDSLLEDFLYEAIFVPEGASAPPKSIINQPELQIYITGFGQKKDHIGLVAEVEKRAVGAVWVRIMNDYGHIDNDTPSFAISLYKDCRGLGIGTALMKKMLTPDLETERLFLRKIQLSDISEIFDCWMTDEDVSRHMYWKASNDIKDTKDFVEFEIRNIENDEWYRWIIVLTETSEIIGTCLVYFNDEENSWDISYNLGKKVWGKGYLSEAMDKVMKYAKDVLQINECIAIHAAENPASGHIL